MIVAIQDMGAAGLTSSSAEMAARGGVGVEVETDKVPVREKGMTPYEIMLSESQERMLVVAEPGRLKDVQAVCTKWELEAAVVGRVTDDGMFRIKHNGVVVAEIPGQRLVDDCPIYESEARESPEVASRRAAEPPSRAKVDLHEALPLLLDTPSIASKRWVFEQYDSTVQASTLFGPGSDAGVLRVGETDFGLAVTVDCNSRLLALDPYEGGKAAVAESARNIACTGAVPLGITDCLNFGNPEKPEVFYQFKEACRGIADACRAFETPVTGGNVSFYNESPTGAVDPTPTIGMVGLLEKLDFKVGSHFQQAGDRIFILGKTAGRLGGSAYWVELHDFVGGEPAPVNLDAERRLQHFLAAAARKKLLRSAHDCSTGGLAVTLAEAAIGGPYAATGRGAAVDLQAYGTGGANKVDETAGAVSAVTALSDAELLFGEDHGRVVISCDPGKDGAIRMLAEEHKVPLHAAGFVGEVNGELAITTSQATYRWPIASLRETYMTAIPRRMGQVVEDSAVEGK
jgi:phosphoribosylformylglycinamidine synthase